MIRGDRKRVMNQGNDPLDTPAYTVAEAAHHLHLPAATVRAWSLGRTYPAAQGMKKAAPLIKIADADTPSLSFRNLVELHVLSGIRRKHRIKMTAVRRAVEYVQQQLGVDHPLADQQMMTDGKDLLVKRYEKLISASERGQFVMRDVLEACLSRIDRDEAGLPIRLYPFTRARIEEDAPKLVVINPRVQFGRPCIAGSGIPTSVIFERYKAGDAVADLARDYDQDIASIEEAIRYESKIAA